MTVKIIWHFRKRTEAQTKKIQEVFNKEQEHIKNKHTRVEQYTHWNEKYTFSERYFKENILFSITSKGIKYLGSKEVKNLYSETCKKLMKEIKDDINRWKIYHVFGLEESILSKLLYYPRKCTESMQRLSNYRRPFLADLKQSLKILYGKTNDPKYSKQPWERKMKLEELALWFQTIL